MIGQDVTSETRRNGKDVFGFISETGLRKGSEVEDGELTGSQKGHDEMYRTVRRTEFLTLILFQTYGLEENTEENTEVC